MDKHAFLSKYRIREESFNKAGVRWDELLAIMAKVEKSRDTLNIDANYVAERLRPLEQVHSVKTRIKDPEHLVEKIIRLKLQRPDLHVDRHNFDSVVTDLVGVRALHLFKEDWEAIHEFIIKTWELKEPPVANVNAEDHGKLIRKYRDRGCTIYEHPFGYRSVHYLILFERSRHETIPVEIQVRTILEEAWSEIDHFVRYPYNEGDTIWSPYLVILNRLVGQADEISSYIKLLKTRADMRPPEFDEEAFSIYTPNLAASRLERSGKKRG